MNQRKPGPLFCPGLRHFLRQFMLLTVILPTVMVLFAALGCNMPDPPIIHEPKLGMLYDTAYEKEAQSGKQRHKILDGVWEPYFDTLAEPVCVTKWDESKSAWQILYATNRATVQASSVTDSGAYGNQVLSRPTFGRATVQLPHRKRGRDPQQSPRKALFASLSKKGDSPDTDRLAEVTALSATPSLEFQQLLHSQIHRSRQKDVLLFVHGFNVDFDSCLIRTAQLGLDIPFNGALVAYSWPTQGGVMNYESDEPVNAASVAPFTQFLAWMIDNLPEEAKLKILVHSMGNRIVLKGINQLQAAPPDRKPIETLCLCAPDVGLSDYRNLIPGVVERCNRVVLYANESDGALKISKSLHLEQRSGDSQLPATMDGVDLIDCSAVDLSFLGHSYFSGNVSVLADLFCVLKENKSPKQCPHLKRKQTSAGDEYWVFHQHPHRILWSWHFDDDDGDPSAE